MSVIKETTSKLNEWISLAQEIADSESVDSHADALQNAANILNVQIAEIDRAGSIGVTSEFYILIGMMEAISKLHSRGTIPAGSATGAHFQSLMSCYLLL